ncbi:MAG: hypothetical protein ACRCYY_21445 [Trueperaceae bacterium]
MKLSHVQYVIAYAPIILLIVLGLNHLRLAQTHDASPWHGGSFGMFAVVDGIFTRGLSAEIVRGGKIESLSLIDYTQEIERILTFPTRGVLEKFAYDVACDVGLDEDNYLKLSYYKARFDKSTLTVTSFLEDRVDGVICDR